MTRAHTLGKRACWCGQHHVRVSRTEPEPVTRKHVGPHREWGDGANRMKAHIIENISFHVPFYVWCIDGVRIGAGSQRQLEDLWDKHRGISVEQIAQRQLDDARTERATDAEVATFLGQVRDPSYQYGGDDE